MNRLKSQYPMLYHAINDLSASLDTIEYLINKHDFDPIEAGKKFEGTINKEVESLIEALGLKTVSK